jgi:uncharacterized protein (DUF305 family)
MTMSSRSIRGRHLTALLLTLLAAFAFAACGGDDGEQSGAGGDVKAVEQAFLTGMVHHHGTAIEMAEIAQERGQSEFVTGLADDIISTQEQEIAKMEAIYDRLIGPAAHDGLGLSAEEAGMTHGPETNEMLEMAMPFDRAFVDEMTPHHTGAVKMANVVLESTEDQELRDLAEGIVAAQEREIEAMNAFRTEEYGAPVPEPEEAAGASMEVGTPADDALPRERPGIDVGRSPQASLRRRPRPQTARSVAPGRPRRTRCRPRRSRRWRC